MKEVLVANNDTNSVIVQCACIGHCSYLEFLTGFDNELWLLISTNNRKKRDIKYIDLIEERFNLSKDKAEIFINMIEEVESIHSNTFVIRDEKCNEKGKLYIRFEYIKLNDKPSKYDQIQITFYLSEKKFMKSESCFDITLSKPMLKPLVKGLRGLYEEKE